MKQHVVYTLLLGALMLTGCTNPLGALNTSPQPNKPAVTVPVPTETPEVVTTPTDTPVTEPPVLTPILFEQSGVFLSVQPPDACGEPQPWLDEDNREQFARKEVNGNATFWGLPYVSYKTPDGTSSVTAQWYQGTVTENPLFDSAFEKTTNIATYAKDWVLMETTQGIKPTISCAQNTYAHVRPTQLGVEGTSLIPVKVIFSIKHEITAEAYFFLQQ